jgi:hypothetical protein
MASQSWMNLLNAGVPWQTTAGTVLNTAASATISPQVATTQDFVLPGQPNGLQWYPGMVLRIIARGTLASGGTTSTLTVFLACGASGTLGSTLSTTAGIVLGTGSITAQPWKLEAHVGCTAIGTSGNTLSTEGELIFGDTATPAFGTANVVISALPLTALAFNTYTAGTALGLRATLSAAFGSILCNQFLIEQLCL